MLFVMTTPDVAIAATTPSLGQAINFGILSSTYTNSVGGTTINGDLGFTTGPATTPTVNGTIHTADATYSQAGTDQGSALSNLNSEVCDFTYGSPTDLSLLSQPLTPGVYCILAAASIGSAGITLSGAGTYIFKIDGAFTTVDNSIVSSIAGASACNIFWAPTSATTLGANTTMMGTVIDNAGITIGSTVTWTGRALAFGGTVSTTTDTITVPSCVSPTPTATATPTGTPTVQPTVVATTTSVPGSQSLSVAIGGSSTCPAVNFAAPNLIESRRIDSDSIFLSWGPYSETNNFNVSFGPTDGNWLYSTDVSGFSTTLNNLPPNVPFWVRVAGRSDCAIGNYGQSRLVGRTIASNPLIPKFPDTGNDPSLLYVPLIGITSVPLPLSLPKEQGEVIYNYAVKNFLSEIALTNIRIIDNKCSAIKFDSGDDNNDLKLDYSETWRYSCKTTLSKTTQNTATVTGSVNNITAKHKAYSTVIVGSDDTPPLVSIINITKISYPLSLPKEGGEITFTYKVNNPGIVPLSNVTVTDDKCKGLTNKLGDTNGNNLLDVNEVWIYSCMTTLTKTTKVTASANGLIALGEVTLTVIVDGQENNLAPLLDVSISSLIVANSNLKYIIWSILSSLLIGQIIIYKFKRKTKKR